MAMGRNVMGGIGGVVAAAVVIAIAEAIGHASLHGDAVFGAAVAGYGLGSMAGSAVAARIANVRIAIAVPVVLAVLAAINLVSFPRPPWFAPAALAVLVVGGFVGSKLGSRRHVQTS